MKKHILVISQYFYPEQFRINDICSEWVKKGYKVTVLTGIPNYPHGEFYKGFGFFAKRREIYNGINIVRIPIIPRKNSPIFLALNYLSFVFTGFFWSLFTSIKADYVFIYEVSPMTQALPGVWYAKRNEIPCYMYVTDLWPENVEIAGGISNKFILNSIGKMVDYIYENCNKIFTSSSSFISAIEERGVNSEKIEFWPQYAEEFYKPIDKSNIEIPEIPKGKMFNIVFAGNIGVSQGLDILLKVAKGLKEKNVEVIFNIVGDGRYKNTLVESVNKNNLKDYFNFIDKQPAIRIPEIMAVNDATLISLKKNKVFAITIPAKTQSCLACGVPILVSADGEIQKVINESKSGFCSASEDADGLLNNILKMIKLSPEQLKKMSKNAVEYSSKNFDKTMLLNRIDKWFGN